MVGAFGSAGQDVVCPVVGRSPGGGVGAAFAAAMSAAEIRTLGSADIGTCPGGCDWWKTGEPCDPGAAGEPVVLGKVACEPAVPGEVGTAWEPVVAGEVGTACEPVVLGDIGTACEPVVLGETGPACEPIALGGCWSGWACIGWPGAECAAAGCAEVTCPAECAADGWPMTGRAILGCVASPACWAELGPLAGCWPDVSRPAERSTDGCG